MANEFIIKNGYFSQGNSNITGSLAVTGGVTASLQGTASWATNSISASYATTASYVSNAVSASYSTTASYADTASYINPLTQNVIITGSLSQGDGAETIGSYSHAEGDSTEALSDWSHAEGSHTITGWRAFTVTSVVAGLITISDNIDYSSAFTSGQLILDNASNIYTYNSISYLAPNFTIQLNDISVNTAYVVADLAVLNSTYANTPMGDNSHAEGSGTVALGEYSHAEGASTRATGAGSHAEGKITTASGGGSHAEGDHTIAYGSAAHVEGYYTTASGDYSHAEGRSTIASGSYSHAEGQNTIASGSYSHAEGKGTVTSGPYSHAEGYYTVAIGDGAHAEGANTTATADNSHAEGLYTVATGKYQHVQGQYNISSSKQSAFIVGNGTSDLNRSNLIFASGSTVQITGSLGVTGGVTASLQGTASYATTALTASNALTASYVNPLTQDVIITGSLNVTSNITGSGLLITGSTSTDLVRITQTGAGNAFVVEDSTNPDLSPFTIDNTGNVGIGIAPSISYKLYVSASTTPAIRGESSGNGVEGVGYIGVVGAGSTVGVQGTHDGSGNGVFGWNYYGAGNGVKGQAINGIGVLGYGGTYGGRFECVSNSSPIGVYGYVTDTESGTGDYIAGKFEAAGPTNKYSVQLLDGTEGTGKVLVSQTSDGKANWSTKLSGSYEITGSLAVSGSVIGQSGNTISSDALVQASLLYLSNNF